MYSLKTFLRSSIERIINKNQIPKRIFKHILYQLEQLLLQSDKRFV